MLIFPRERVENGVFRTILTREIHTSGVKFTLWGVLRVVAGESSLFAE
jgi:hypothetical protein